MSRQFLVGWRKSETRACVLSANHSICYPFPQKCHFFAFHLHNLLPSHFLAFLKCPQSAISKIQSFSSVKRWSRSPPSNHFVPTLLFLILFRWGSTFLFNCRSLKAEQWAREKEQLILCLLIALLVTLCHFPFSFNVANFEILTSSWAKSKSEIEKVRIEHKQHDGLFKIALLAVGQFKKDLKRSEHFCSCSSLATHAFFQKKFTHEARNW